ncbi:MAG: NAD(P)H-hydrate dehydratase [Deltaproteobacteria bacterium]|nr:NAD(P)H-hydrate dehydratase [Deltaproteobacteria bacterium]
MLLVTAREMAELDRKTIHEIGIPGIVLMENAARGAAAFYLDLVPDLFKRRIAIVAGTGNNAGDGFVLARIFHDRGAPTQVFCLRPPERLQGDALTNFSILEKMGVPVTVWDEGMDFNTQWKGVAENHVLVDAILGTGLKREVQGLYRKVIESINALPVPRLAVDIPSGLDACTGKVLGAAVMATGTATFGCLKIGQVIEPGMDYVGRLHVVDIGIPRDVIQGSGIQRWWADETFLKGWLKPRHPGVHKGTAGHVCVLSGSRGKTGAAALVCQGASRVGAGLVTLFIPDSLNSILEVKLTEAMTFPVPETEERSPSPSALPRILEFLQGKQVLAMGPGISLHQGTQELVRQVVGQARCPLVLDADALTAIVGHLPLLGQARGPVIVTPHPGEMARLTEQNTREIQENRLEVASAFSRRHGVTLVLKGLRTIIASSDGRLAVNSSGNPAMASGGMGDTLTGMIAGLVAQGYGPFEAACLGVYIHGAAADRCMGAVATRGLLASDALGEIPAVIGRLESSHHAAPSCGL